MTQTLEVTRTRGAAGARPDRRTPAAGAEPVARGLVWALAALGLGLAVNSILGPLGLDVIDYALSESLRNQLLGLDAVSLLLVAPLCALAAILTARRRVAGPVLALGPASYTAYMFVQYVVGPGYQRYPSVLVFHLGLFTLSWVTGAVAWARVPVAAVPPLRHRRALSWVAFGLAAFVVSRYLPALVGSLGEEPLTEEFRTEPAFFWTILLLDLGIVVPGALATGLALRRNHPLGPKAMYGVAAWFALVPPSVAAMALAMLVNDDPNASTAGTVLFTLAAVAGGGLAVRLFTPVVRGARPPS